MKVNMAKTCLLECNCFMFVSIKDWKILITKEMHWTLSFLFILDDITDRSTSWTMWCILKKVYGSSLPCKHDNEVELKSLVLINSSVCPVTRNLMKSTATSTGRGSASQSENKQNTSRRTSSVSKALVIAIWMAVVVVLEYAMFWFARSLAAASRSPRERASK